MSKFAKFMKANKAVKENGFYPATKSLCDEKGNPQAEYVPSETEKQPLHSAYDCGFRGYA